MTLKILTFLALVGFAWWRLRRFLYGRTLQKQGIKRPEPQGIRPIAIFAGAMVAVYAGVLLWHMLGFAAP
ncbi:hypothetical protein HUS23_07050 [Ectothiorhodospiraceae bacterium 2226]|nr:hypothetical protein HUS23_07050 [Ectothiorhodospiraceae bacterium 2226]